MEINNALMDSLLDWREVFITVFSLDISEFSKIVILEFSDSPTQILVFFLSKNSRLGDANRILFRLRPYELLKNRLLTDK